MAQSEVSILLQRVKEMIKAEDLQTMPSSLPPDYLIRRRLLLDNMNDLFAIIQAGVVTLHLAVNLLDMTISMLGISDSRRMILAAISCVRLACTAPCVVLVFLLCVRR